MALCTDSHGYAQLALVKKRLHGWCAGVLNFLFSRDPRFVNDGCCGPRSRSAAKAAVGIKTRRLPPDLALIGGPDPAVADPAAAAVAAEPEEGGALGLWSTLVEIQTVMSIPSFLIIIVQARCSRSTCCAAATSMISHLLCP